MDRQHGLGRTEKGWPMPVRGWLSPLDSYSSADLVEHNSLFVGNHIPSVTLVATGSHPVTVRIFLKIKPVGRREMEDLSLW